jgi:glucose-1-phosphate cytidylyltransferase
VKVIILAGGLGTRISEETSDKPKPMVLLNQKPILWHIMSIYASQGFKEFIVAAGYKGDVISQWVTNLNSDWDIQVVDTGVDTQTGGRVKQCMKLFPEESFFVTYGDGLANVDLKKLLEFHSNHGKLATLTAVRPPARFGYLELDKSEVVNFGEKKQSKAGWINGGFFLLEPEVKSYVWGDEEPLEIGALPRLVEKSQLMAFRHEGFWQPMDTLREKNDLNQLALENTPLWLQGY